MAVLGSRGVIGVVELDELDAEVVDGNGNTHFEGS